jgi:hypothetical protein
MAVGLVNSPPVRRSIWAAKSHGLLCTVRTLTSSHHAFTGDIAVLTSAWPASGHVV